MRYLVCFALFTATSTAAETKPNVLFIAVDDLNVWVSCLNGHPQTKTPNIDRLAKRGMLFSRAYCAAPACNPSRAALMCGKRPTTTGIYHNDQPWEPILKNELTMEEHFQKNGYRVLGGGKIYHGQRIIQGRWDDYFTSKAKGGVKERSLNGLNKGHFDWGPIDTKDEDMPDHQLSTWAVEQLGKRHDKPLFLAVGYTKPHLPWYVPKKYFEMFPLESIQLPKVSEKDLDDLPSAGVKMARPEGDHAAVLKGDQWKKAVQGYLAAIAFLDGQVGRVLDALDKGPHKDNTIIVFWGDHGWHLGEKQHWRKFALWEEATRAPLIVAAPGVTKAASKCDTPVDFMTFYPTLCDLCGLKTPEHVEGKSLRPLLVDPSAKWEQAALTTHGRGNHAVRLGSWRYIRYADGGEELYDHSADPLEWKNLAKDEKFKEKIAELSKHLPTQEAKNAPTMK